MAYAPQLTNVGKNGQDARYSIAGLPEVRPGVYSDGTYEYDSRGLDLSGRKAENLSNLRGADENFVDGQYSYASGGGGGGSYSPNMSAYGFNVAQAKLAYDRAVAAKNEKIAKLNRSTGFMRVGDKTQIDPNNPYGALQLLLGKHGGQLDDAWGAAADRGIGHKGLGAQGETMLRFAQGGEVADLGNQYSDAYKQYLQEEADAKAQYELAQQMEMYNAIQGGGYDYGDPGGDDYGDDSYEPDVFAPLANANLQQLAAALLPISSYKQTYAKPPAPKPAPKPAVSKPKISAKKVVSRG